MIEQNYAFISQSAQTLKKTIVLLRLIRKVVTMKTKCPNDCYHTWIFKKVSVMSAIHMNELCSIE